jgi:hypothetical protein
MPDATNAGLTAEAMQPLFVFLWAAGGSLALEVISLYNELKAERAEGLPSYYKNPAFWFARDRNRQRPRHR